MPMEDPILKAHREQQQTRRKLVDELTKKLVDDGKLIEAGWQSMRLLAIPADASEVQLTEMRNAFFGGAQHLFGSIMSMLDLGSEPTTADLRRMDQIEKELQEFIAVFVQRHRTAGRA